MSEDTLGGKISERDVGITGVGSWAGEKSRMRRDMND